MNNIISECQKWTQRGEHLRIQAGQAGALDLGGFGSRPTPASRRVRAAAVRKSRAGFRGQPTCVPPELRQAATARARRL